MARSKHNWPQVWKSIVCITVGCVLSVALYGLLYWAAGLWAMPFDFDLAVFFIWLGCSIVMLRRYVQNVQNDNARSLVYVFLGSTLFGGILGMGNYIHHSVSSYKMCELMTKEYVGDAEYVLCNNTVSVDTSSVGYDIFQKKHYQRNGTRVSFEACVAAPIKDSHGIYVVYQVNGDKHSSLFTSDNKMEGYYHVFCIELHDTLRHHQYDERCRTYHRITENDPDYDHYVKAVEEASILLNDTSYYVQNSPVVLEPVYDVGLGDDAHVDVGFIIWFIGSLALTWAGLMIARTRRKKGPKKADDDSDSVDKLVHYVKNPKNRSCVLIVTVLTLYYLVSLALGYNNDPSRLLDYGAVWGYSVFMQDEWWRLLTSMLMHADFFHLIGNLVVLVVIISLSGQLFQGWRGLLVFVVTGFVAAICCALYTDYVTVGASGAILGMLGYGISVTAYRQISITGTLSKALYIQIGVAVAYVLLTSFGDDVSVVSHVSGVVAGTIMGLISAYRSTRQYTMDDEDY